MAYNGYLKLNKKLEDDEYLLTIPNYEIQTFFKKGFIDKYLIGSNYFNPIMRTLLEGNIEEFGRMLEEIFLINTSFHDLKAERYDVGIKESEIDKIYRIGLAFRGKKVKIKYELA